MEALVFGNRPTAAMTKEERRLPVKVKRPLLVKNLPHDTNKGFAEGYLPSGKTPSDILLP
jgi:hypothetical protein